MILNSRVSLALLRNDDSQVEDVDPLGRRLQGRCRVGDNTQKKIFPQILEELYEMNPFFIFISNTINIFCPVNDILGNINVGFKF